MIQSPWYLGHICWALGLPRLSPEWPGAFLRATCWNRWAGPWEELVPDEQTFLEALPHGGSLEESGVLWLGIPSISSLFAVGMALLSLLR